MADNKSKLTIEDYKSEFTFKKKENGLNIQFNRVAFIFFVFFIIYLIYAIHLIHLGLRNDNSVQKNNLSISKNKLYRADIIDRNGKYLSKTVSSIDIGISTRKVIDKKNAEIEKEQLKVLEENKELITQQNLEMKKIQEEKQKLLNEIDGSKKKLNLKDR